MLTRRTALSALVLVALVFATGMAPAGPAPAAIEREVDSSKDGLLATFAISATSPAYVVPLMIDLAKLTFVIVGGSEEGTTYDSGDPLQDPNDVTTYDSTSDPVLQAGDGGGMSGGGGW